MSVAARSMVDELNAHLASLNAEETPLVPA